MAISEYHQQLRARVEDAVNHLPAVELSFREMFGGVMLYTAGLVSTYSTQI